MSIASISGETPKVESGEYAGFRYEIINPSTMTAMLKIYIPAEKEVRAIPGCLFAASTNIEVKGKLKKSLKSMLGTEDIRHQTLKAKHEDGWVLLSPGVFGSITPVTVNNEEICVGDNGYLASFGELDSKSDTEGGKKGLLSSTHGMFVQTLKGIGVAFLCAAGSMMTFDLGVGETVVVNDGHLVSWPKEMKYKIVKAADSWFSSGVSGEGVVAEMTGPGRFNVQSRNPEEMAQWTYGAKSPSSSG